MRYTLTIARFGYIKVDFNGDLDEEIAETGCG